MFCFQYLHRELNMTSKVTVFTLILSASSTVFWPSRAANADTMDNEQDLVSMTTTVHDYMLPGE
jgi:hypothetical protein